MAGLLDEDPALGDSRLVASAPEGGVAELAPMAPERLPPGRHGLPADIVRNHQRQRLLEAAAAALAEQGYGRLTAARVTELAGVSSRTFYQHFEDLWACLLAAYETEAGFLRGAIEVAPRWRWSRPAPPTASRNGCASWSRS